MRRLLRWVIPDMPFGWQLPDAMHEEWRLMRAYHLITRRWVGDMAVYDDELRVIA